MGVAAPYSTFSDTTPAGRERGDFRASEGRSLSSPPGICSWDHSDFCGVGQEWSYLIATFSSTKSGVCKSKSKPRELTTMSLLCAEVSSMFAFSSLLPDIPS